MNKNNEAAETAMSDRIASNEQENTENRGGSERDGVKRTFGVASLWAIRRAGRVFRIHNRLSRI